MSKKKKKKVTDFKDTLYATGFYNREELLCIQSDEGTTASTAI